jgi:hypothetical protein
MNNNIKRDKDHPFFSDFEEDFEEKRSKVILFLG